jgi:hypothetical protein
MFNLKPDLRESEMVHGEYGATVYAVRGTVSSSGSNVRLWLTNQRIILRAALSPQRTLPLYAITSVREEKIGWHNMVRLEFAGDHLEWLTVQNQPQFLQALQAAQAQAPDIPEGISPAKIGPVIPALFGGGLLFMAVIAACTLTGSCLFFAVFGALWFIAKTR